MNIENYFLDEVILKNYAKEVLECYDMLVDGTSRDVYAGIIKWRLTGCSTSCRKFGRNSFICMERSIGIGQVHIETRL